MLRPSFNFVRPLLALCAVLLLPACSSLEPWVKPYERERLADPILQWQRHALADKHREHIHAVREAGRGATGVQGGGCGCN
jgi:outer membrane biogenesis lipoprotein LolB